MAEIEIRYIGGSREKSEDKTGGGNEDGQVIRALEGDPRDISAWPKYLYDAQGSRLFEEITEQPEYYQTRTELEILRRFSSEILREGSFGTLVEIGSGSSIKTRTLIEDMISLNVSLLYIPFDVSESALRESSTYLSKEYPSINILGYVGDFGNSVGELLSTTAPENESPRLIILLGGTIGNFSPKDRLNFLREIRSGMNKRDKLLVGLDLVKSVSTIEAAYNDEAGVTAAFNKNVLTVLNGTLGTNFDPELFSHTASFDVEYERIEMWLYSLVDQHVYVPGYDTHLHFSRGEGIRTELSHKFSKGSAKEMFKGSGMKLSGFYTDDDELFGLALAEPE